MCSDSEWHFSNVLHSFDHRKDPVVDTFEVHDNSKHPHSVQSLFWSLHHLLLHVVDLFLHYDYVDNGDVPGQREDHGDGLVRSLDEDVVDEGCR